MYVQETLTVRIPEIRVGIRVDGVTILSFTGPLASSPSYYLEVRHDDGRRFKGLRPENGEVATLLRDSASEPAIPH